MTDAQQGQRSIRLSGLLDAGLVLLALGLVSPWLARVIAGSSWTHLAWLVDLASHWQWLFCVMLLLFTLIRALQGARAPLTLLVLLPLPWLSAAPALPTQAAATSVPHLRIAAVNLLVSNTDANGLRAFLDRVQPDVVVLTELHPDIAKVAGTWADYPERYLLAEDSPFGIGVLSRVPWADSQAHLDADGLPEIDVRLLWQDQTVMLSALHPMPPMSARWHLARADKLQAAAARQTPFAGPKLLVGDLNASPWSSAMAPLTPSYQRANSLKATWPSNWLGWIGIPIDLILASPHWAVQQFQVEAAFGSDHHPVWADLVLLPPVDANTTAP